ncbi:TrkH family potassium uptake protein [Actinoplanes teichomyceticus]|uniref:Trk-type K+ transport system membrane component n=1 Tax=Actinoplanes teichomyceticus TaxID=1867 RepID=A0A561VM24_ACTTI|nr:potassium transporter TrkG [Actinoplanes teichomyceticus]TWG12665.1 Trk-type K+ transport system membrane component [Actinoplanes teichomyceticus]
MESTAGQLLLGLLLLAGLFLAVGLGFAVLVWTPMPAAGRERRPGSYRDRSAGYRAWPRAVAGRLWARARHGRLTLLVAGRLSQAVAHPARLVVSGFTAAVLAGSLLLMLPFATASGHGAPPVTAMFTATSAVCVTGLVVVDTGTYWSGFGELVILLLIQVGGFGIMTLASLLGLLVARRLRMRLRLGAQAETKALGVGEVRGVILGVLRVSVLVELAVAAVLTWRFAVGYANSWSHAGYLGVFHAVSAFNNAGFGLYPDSLMRFAGDPLICLPINAAVIVGGLGFPVLFELRREFRTPRHWSLHTRITVGMSVLCLAAGWLAIAAAEWTNKATLGPLGLADKLLASLTTAVMPRTAGFNSLDVAGMRDLTLLIHDVLMFIGGGSAGTAGGIKVTTFAVLGFVILAEIRGEPSVHALGRRLPSGVQRQALTIALLGVAAITVSTLGLLALTPFTLDAVLFETTSAFATVGLSTGITAHVGTAGHVILGLLMFVGRLGPATAVTALALRERTRRYERAEERPIVG